MNPKNTLEFRLQWIKLENEPLLLYLLMFMKNKQPLFQLIILKCLSINGIPVGTLIMVYC